MTTKKPLALVLIVVCQTFFISALLYKHFYINRKSKFSFKKTSDDLEKHGKIFYNRVPKCGSHSMIDLLHLASERNGFGVLRDKRYMKFFDTEQEKWKLAKYFARVPGPFVYERHYHFLHFQE